MFVQGYREKKQWIATQLPLSNTIADFWQLIIEQDIQIVVQLEGSPVSEVIERVQWKVCFR